MCYNYVKIMDTNMATSDNYIEQRKQYWGPEFASLAEIDYNPKHNEIAAMGCYTLAYHIADNFRGGEFRKEILEMLGIEA